MSKDMLSSKWCESWKSLLLTYIGSSLAFTLLHALSTVVYRNGGDSGGKIFTSIILSHIAYIPIIVMYLNNCRHLTQKKHKSRCLFMVGLGSIITCEVINIIVLGCILIIK